MYVAIACYTCMHVHLDVHTRIYVAIAICNLSAAFCNLYLLLYVCIYRSIYAYRKPIAQFSRLSTYLRTVANFNSYTFKSIYTV